MFRRPHPMAFVTPSSVAEAYDVIVVGSGAAGGQAAYTLTMEGARVLMLEAGRNYDPRTETPMFQTPNGAPLRGAPTPDKPFGFFDATVGGGWTVPGEPYTNASEDESQQFQWYRARMLGGRTNHWARHALRNGPYDFKPHSRDGLGFDWPISYEDVAPYYDKVEMLIGVYGTNEGLENTPDSPRAACCRPPRRGSGNSWRGSAAGNWESRSSPSGEPSSRGPSTTRRSRQSSTPATRGPSGSLPRTCRCGRPASGRPPAGAAARAGRTTRQPPCTFRRRLRRETWTS